jgi:pyroglutamyl-peptidase
MKVLVAGFGPFPGVPSNPSGELACALARLRRPALADVELHAAIFPTVYSTLARDLPRMLDRLRPDAVLLIGLAGGYELRVETRAVNAASQTHADAARALPPAQKLVAKAPYERKVRPAARRLLGALRGARVRARLSRDAGNYLCNASLYLSLDPGRRKPPLVTFIHIPPPAERRPRRRGPIGDQSSMGALLRACEAALRTLIAEARRP